MNKHLRIATIIGLSASIGLFGLLAGCGSKTTNAPAGSSGTSVKKVVVAVASETKPLSYIDESGKLVGYEVEALKAIDKLIPEYEFEYISVEQASQQIGLDTGKYAIISDGLYKTKEREEKYLIPAENVGTSSIKMTIRGNETSIKKLDDLVGKKIAPLSPNGGIFNLITNYNKEHKDQITFTTQEGLSMAERIQGVASGKYDALVAPSLGFEDLKKQLKLDVKQTEPVQVNNTYFVLAKDKTDLAAKVNEALKSIKNDGSLSKLAVQYFGEDVLKYTVK